MPPKAKYTREKIIDAALRLVRKSGISALTARNLGAELGCSSQPVFSEFRNMDEVQQETIKAALEIYHGYISGKGADSDAFRRIDYIRFAKDEPKLFAILFMAPVKEEFSLSDVLPGVFTNSEALIESVQRDYRVSYDSAHTLCSSMWLFIHGIACLCATGMTLFIEEEVEKLVNDTFESILSRLK